MLSQSGPLQLCSGQLSQVLGSLDVESLLEVTMTCCDIQNLVRGLEDSLWKEIWKETELSMPQGADFRASELIPKSQYRLCRYLSQRGLPSLHDALRCAADHGHEAVLELLLHVRADPNLAADSGAFGVGFTQVGAYPLHLAAKRGRRRVMEVLLRAGAAVDAADQNGRTALMVAAASGQCGASSWLLEHRADVDWKTHYGYTALHHAALVPRPEVVEILLEGRASTEVMDREGRTALHATLSTLPSGPSSRRTATTSCDPAGIGDEYCYDHDISHGYRRMEQEEFQLRAVKTAVMALLRSRADVHVRDGFGRSALDIAKDKRRGDLASWLQSLGEGNRSALQTTDRKSVV